MNDIFFLVLLCIVVIGIIKLLMKPQGMSRLKITIVGVIALLILLLGDLYFYNPE